MFSASPITAEDLRLCCVLGSAICRYHPHKQHSRITLCNCLPLNEYMAQLLCQSQPETVSDSSLCSVRICRHLHFPCFKSLQTCIDSIALMLWHMDLRAVLLQC